jgi:hypothetical protein
VSRTSCNFLALKRGLAFDPEDRYRCVPDLPNQVGWNVRKLSLGVALATLAFVGAAVAQPYLSHPITLIVPFGAGGPVDTLARTLTDAMRTSLGQAVIIENVTGASGTIGVGRGARRPRRVHRQHRQLAFARRERSDLCAAVRRAEGFRTGRASRLAVFGRGKLLDAIIFAQQLNSS